MIQSTLVAGVTGSGKTYAVKKFIDRVLEDGALCILLDPKRVSFKQFAKRTGVSVYACERYEMLDALTDAVYLMEDRFSEMETKGIEEYDGPPVYIVIDEMLYFTTDPDIKKEAVEKMVNLSFLGRAARVFLIACSQEATQDSIPARIKRNMSNKICLRQDMPCNYRYLLGTSVAPIIQRYGSAYVRTPGMIRPELVRTDKVWDIIEKYY